MTKNRFDMGPQDIAWCPGCGDYGILQVLKDALFELDYHPEGVVFVSGIGQAAKTPQYIKGNFFNGLHGRALPPATAISLSNPDLKVIVTSGDGDMYGEGGNHFIHTIRRNPNITVFVYNNMIYGLTKGQASPTSQKGMNTPVQTDGVFLEPFNPLAVAISLDASFVARASIADPDQTKEIMKKALHHKGFSIVDIFQPCVSFNKLNTYDWFREHTYYLENHDSSNKMKALEKSFETEKMPLGIFYIHDKPTLNEFVFSNHGIEGALYKQNFDKKKLDALIDSKKHHTDKVSSTTSSVNKSQNSEPKSAKETLKDSNGSQQKYRVVIKEKWDETPTVRSFVLSIPSEYKFKAGQDIMVGFPDEREINGKKQIPLTISNPPTDGNKIILTLRNMGGFSKEIYNSNKGDELLITSPIGSTFVVDENSEDSFVFLSGGTGITPFMSIIRFLLASNKKNKVVLFNASRAPDEIIFKKELDKINEEQENIRVHYVLSESCPPDVNGDSGFICDDVLSKYITDDEKKNYKWFICGPPPMVDEMKKLVKDIDIPKDNVILEEWQLPGQEQKNEENKSDEVKSSDITSENKKFGNEDVDEMNENKNLSESSNESGEVILASESQEVELNPGPIMSAAEELGVPFSCRQGICGTCEVEVVEGMENLEPKNDKENNMKLPDGSRLCCQAEIKQGKVKIDF